MIKQIRERPKNLMRSLRIAMLSSPSESKVDKLQDLEAAFAEKLNIEYVMACKNEIAQTQLAMHQYEKALHTLSIGLELNASNHAKGAFLYNRAVVLEVIGLEERARQDYLAARPLIDPAYHPMVEYGLQSIGKDKGPLSMIISIQIL